MHVTEFQRTFKLLIWPLTTLYDLCLLFHHQNPVHWPQKWLETRVTLIYYDVIYQPYARFYKMAAILDFSLYSILHRREDRWKFILGRKYVRKKSTRSINLEMFKEADIIIAMHVIGFQMSFKLSIWPLRTLYDICSHLQHQNRVHWPRKWLETCVTLIY